MMSFLKDFWAFLSTRKKYWLLPIPLMIFRLGRFWCSRKEA